MFGAACQPAAPLLFSWQGVVLWGESDRQSQGLSYGFGLQRTGAVTWPHVHLGFRYLGLFKQRRNFVQFPKARL